MKKVRLIKDYLDWKIGEIIKTDGQTARNLVEREIAIDPEGKMKKTEIKIESAMMEPEEKAVLPKAKPKRERWNARRK